MASSMAADPVPAQCPPLRLLLAAGQAGAALLGERLREARLPFVVVGQSASESRVLQLFFSLAPDVIVLDWRVAEHEPARLVGLLKRVAPAACVVALVPAPDSMPAHAARALGADAVTVPEGLPAQLETIARARSCSA